VSTGPRRNSIFGFTHGGQDENGLFKPRHVLPNFLRVRSRRVLAEKYFKKYGGSEQTAKLMAKVREARALLEKIKKAVEAGVIKTVDGFQSDK